MEDLSESINLFCFRLPIINKLKEQGNSIKITVLRRGKLPVIARNELNEYKIHFIGRHRGTNFSIILEANIIKFFELFWLCLKFKPDIGVSVGSFILGAVLKIQRRCNIQFDDDPERKINVFLEKLTSDKLYFPIFFKRTNKKIGRYKALKEWSYLSPNYFSPDIKVLNEYGLLPKKYIFIREVSTGSLNYSYQKKNIIASIAHLFPSNIKVILSLEEKIDEKNYPYNWIILKEPVHNIHSLVYFSRLVISSGDSMAREGAMLGVPSIYCGIRDMLVNNVLIEKGMLYAVNFLNVPELINYILSKKIETCEQNAFRQNLLNEWEDVNRFVINSINNFIL